MGMESTPRGKTLLDTQFMSSPPLRKDELRNKDANLGYSVKEELWEFWIPDNKTHRMEEL